MAHQQNHQQQKASYPQPPGLTRPASVLLESSTGYHSQDQNSVSGRPRSHSHTVYSNYIPPPSLPSSSTLSQDAGDNPIRFQTSRQPPHRSKLSKQYTPSEEDSDDEPLGMTATYTGDKRRTKFMSGTAFELNSDIGESPRALSEMNLSQTPSRSATPSLTESGDSASVKSTKKKISLGKRISMFFTGSSSSGGTSSHRSSTPSALSQPPSNGSEKSALENEARLSSASLAPIDELTPPGRIHSVYIHQRSQSTPDQIGATDFGHGRPRSQTGASSTSVSSQNPRTEDSLLRKARDSGFEETEGRGHRRYSTATGTAPLNGRVAHSTLQAPSSGHNRSSIYVDQQQQQTPSSSQQVRRSVYGVPSASASPQLRSVSDRDLNLLLQPQHPFPQNHRHSFMSAELANYASPSSNDPAMPRRSSTPVPPTQTLISKVDREKASVCFQQPSTKKKTYTRDTHLDPALSNLVQQHRKDFKTNQRLGGTPTPSSQQQQQYSHLQPGGSPNMRASMYMTEDLHQYQQQQQQQQLMPYQTSPGLYASETRMKRLSTSSSQNFQLPLHHQPPSPGHHRGSFSAGQQLPQQQSQQPSPLLGPHRTSPQRQNSAGYFTVQQQQQQQQQFDPPQLLQVSPFPSPSLGAVQTVVVPDMSVQQQQQQQQLQQLQQIRLQQQHLLLQQQQNLQQQLQQTRLTVTSNTPQPTVTPIGLGLGVVPTTPVLTGVPNLGVGMGMGMVVSPGAISPLALAPGYPQQQQQQYVPMQQIQVQPLGTYGTAAVPLYASAAYH
ncbi:hypothetical protein BGX28_003814 [Mortierella sp. GBA30]|nr:hypothetical protein BGX28_003814 [Mortierella sp. GBA30]